MARPVPDQAGDRVGAVRVLEQERELVVARAAALRPVVQPLLDVVVEEDDRDAVVALGGACERDEQRPGRFEIESRVDTLLIDGLALIREAKRLKPDLPVIIITAGDMSVAILKFRPFKVEKIIPKALGIPDALLATTREILGE